MIDVSDRAATKSDLVALKGKVSQLTWMVTFNTGLVLLVLGKLFFR
jgi:hypothetical protein